MHADPAFLAHATNGTHRAALLVQVCGPCFMGFCKGCEKVRRSDIQVWKCRCMHADPLVFEETVVAHDHMRHVWSEWLESGRNSSVQLGTEVPAMDPTNPIKEYRDEH
jgi:hypothetical protein